MSLNGELLSVICHRGHDNEGGHFVSYHNVTGQWYLNNDDQLFRPSRNPLLQEVSSETVDILFFRSQT